MTNGEGRRLAPAGRGPPPRRPTRSGIASRARHATKPSRGQPGAVRRHVVVLAGGAAHVCSSGPRPSSRPTERCDSNGCNKPGRGQPPCWNQPDRGTSPPCPVSDTITVDEMWEWRRSRKLVFSDCALMRARPARPAQSSVFHNFARRGPTKEAHRRALNRPDGLLRSVAGQTDRGRLPLPPHPLRDPSRWLV
jgi:hypothetical protein